MVKFILFFICLWVATSGVAQTPVDTTVVKIKPVKKIKPVPVKKDTSALREHIAADTLLNAIDTAATSPWTAALKKPHHRLFYRGVLQLNPFYNFFAVPQNIFAEERPAGGKDALFYIMAGLLFFFALVKLLFNRYVTNLLGLVFRGSVRQKQIREQLLQTPLPSLFLNIFFVIVAGLYVFFLVHYYGMGTNTPFWLLLLYCVLAVAVVYVVKFMILKLTGWIFNMRDAADTYIFIVFLVNKLLAIFLLPLLIIMTFSLSSWGNVLVTLSYLMVALFFTYRYAVSFAPVRREVKVSQFHFFVYLCAFEIIPLLLIYKVLVQVF